MCFADYVLSNPQAEEYYSFAACETMYMPFEEPTAPIVLNATPSDDDDSITLDWLMPNSQLQIIILGLRLIYKLPDIPEVK